MERGPQKDSSPPSAVGAALWFWGRWSVLEPVMVPLDEVLNAAVKVGEVHNRLFLIGDFNQIYEAMEKAEQRIARCLSSSP